MSHFFSLDQEVIVGPRYRYEDCRGGMGPSLVLEVDSHRIGSHKYGDPVMIPSPISGPIVRLPFKDKWQAGCLQCLDVSKQYKSKNQPALRGWASTHRCGR